MRGYNGHINVPSSPSILNNKFINAVNAVYARM